MSSEADASLTEEQLRDLSESFNQIDLDGSGYLESGELLEALKLLGFKMAPYQVRDLMEKFDIEERDGKLTVAEFSKLYKELRLQDYGFTAKKSVKTREGLEKYTSQSAHANEDIQHSIRHEQQVAFADYINRYMQDDKECSNYLPFSSDGSDLYEKCRDGILLCKMINLAVPDTIDVRAINMGPNLSVFLRHENVVLALNSARAIGCNVINIGPSDIDDGVKHLLLGLIWQIIKVALLSDISLASHAELAQVMKEDEALEDLRKSSPLELLLRWMNHQLESAGSERRVNNFTSDIQDSEVYAHILKQIAPPSKKLTHPSVARILEERDPYKRAEMVLTNADCLDARVFVKPEDIVAGNRELNMAFVAHLFNTYPNLEPIEKDVDAYDAVLQETREEKTYRNWLNSIGVSPYVNYLYSDLTDGLIIFQIFDVIHPGIVDYSRVNKSFSKMKEPFQKLENCNYIIELGKKCRFSLVGIGGDDLRCGNVTLTLAVVWQLMRAYTLSILTKLNASGTPIQDRFILDWATNMLTQSGKTSGIASFQDPTLRTSYAIIDLVDAVSPGSINYDLVHRTDTPDDNLMNAKYAISVARKIGAKVYALPEDITEVNSKMVLTVVACLMIVWLEKNPAE